MLTIKVLSLGMTNKLADSFTREFMSETQKLQKQSELETYTIDEDIDSQGGYYLSGLFNIETSPGYIALESLKGRKDYSEER
jgi:hypothetical protein